MISENYNATHFNKSKTPSVISSDRDGFYFSDYVSGCLSAFSKDSFEFILDITACRVYTVITVIK